MKEQVNHRIRKHFNELIYHIARYTEILLSVLILVAIAKASIPLINQLFHLAVLDMQMEYFTEFLSDALSLVVGVEFVKMLCRHTSETLVEVLMFAIARQMVVEHLDTWATLVGVVAIAILFAVRKFLLLKPEEEAEGKDKL